MKNNVCRRVAGLFIAVEREREEEGLYGCARHFSKKGKRKCFVFFAVAMGMGYCVSERLVEDEEELNRKSYFEKCF